jgi:hypothetical protein
MLGGIFGGTLGRPGMMGTVNASATPMNPFQNQGTYATGAGGGMDVMGTFEKQNREMEAFHRSPGANPVNYDGSAGGLDPNGGYGGGSPF